MNVVKQPARSINLVAVAIGRVKLVDEELEVLVSILLVIAGQSLVAGHHQLNVARNRTVGLFYTHLVTVPRSKKNVQRRVTPHFVGSAEIRECIIQGTAYTVLMGAPAGNVATAKEKALDHRIVDDGLQDHTHEASLSHVEETSRESTSTGQRG